MVELIGLKVAGVAVMLGIFVAIALLLRLLFGPGGRFREAHWDAPADAEKLDGQPVNAAGGTEIPRKVGDIEEPRKVFEAYAHGFYTGDAAVDEQIDLKRRHTANVVAAAGRIAATEPAFADQTLRRALNLAALFHDVGRFEQLAVYKTYADALSCNHALLGSKVLRRQGFLGRETARIKRLTRIAVALHNRVTVPDGVAGEARLVLEALRDADKLDILRIMAENLGPGRKPDPIVVLHLGGEGGITPVVWGDFQARRTARYADMRTLNDFRLLLCTWLFEVRFRTSLEILARDRHLDTITAGMVGVPMEQAEARRLVDEFLGPLRGVTDEDSLHA